MAFIAKGLQVFGALALATVVAVFGYIMYSFASDSDRINTATKDNVKFVLNWGGLQANQDYKVLSSFESQRFLNGDHLDHYCIQITDFSPAVNQKENWVPISALDGVAKQAVTQAQTTGNATQCFGRERQNSAELQVYVWSITFHGHSVTAYDIIIFDTQSKRLLYVSDQT